MCSRTLIGFEYDMDSESNVLSELSLHKDI